MKQLDLNGLANYKTAFAELSKLYLEAKDNVKFLTTLERHFKNITSGSLSQIVETISSMMNAIRMVWIISRHYNTDERMVPLMGRIADAIASKVADVIQVPAVLRRGTEAAMRDINQATKVLHSWWDTYRDVRDRIERSGNDHRWEFDKKLLFGRTNHMASICQDLAEVAKVLDQVRAVDWLVG